eukprot:SAG22_NODE_2895_length_2119_cov_1.504455_1_plen_277_part_10
MNYPRLKLPCGDFKGCKCDRGRPQNYFNLFAVGTEQDSQQICAPYGDSTKAKHFVANIRPGLPEAPVQKPGKRPPKDRAPALCSHVRKHIWGRLGKKPVLLGSIPDTINEMTDRLGAALCESDTTAPLGQPVSTGVGPTAVAIPAHGPVAPLSTQPAVLDGAVGSAMATVAPLQSSVVTLERLVGQQQLQIATLESQLSAAHAEIQSLKGQLSQQSVAEQSAAADVSAVFEDLGSPVNANAAASTNERKAAQQPWESLDGAGNLPDGDTQAAEDMRW